MVPFINSTIRLLIASPRPYHQIFFVLDPSSCVNGLKMLSAVSVSKPDVPGQSLQTGQFLWLGSL